MAGSTVSIEKVTSQISFGMDADADVVRFVADALNSYLGLAQYVVQGAEVQVKETSGIVRRVVLPMQE
jgi:hypothetical protein